MPIADALDRRAAEREQEEKTRAAEDYRVLLFEMADIPDSDWTADLLDRLTDALTRARVPVRDAQDDLSSIRRHAQQEARLPKLDGEIADALKAAERLEKEAGAGKFSLADAEAMSVRIRAGRESVEALKKQRGKVAEDIRQTKAGHPRIFPRV